MRARLVTLTQFDRVRMSLVITAVVVSGVLVDRASAEEAMRIESSYSFVETLSRLRSMFESKSLTIFATIDHSAAAKSVGLDMPPTTVLVYGSPRVGTPLMLSAPDFALELPLRILVREDQHGHVYVIYNPSTTLDGKHGLAPGLAGNLAPVEKLIATTVTMQPTEK